jgi:5-methylcytosine-specific restriction endonuclease McrA
MNSLDISTFKQRKKQYDRQRYLDNRTKMLEISKKYRETHKEKMKALHKKWYYNNIEYVRKYGREYGKLHPDKRRINVYKYYLRNKLLCHQRHIAWAKNERTKNPEYRLKVNLTCLFKKGIQRNNTSNFIKGIGYTIPELKQHLEKQFTPEMNWANYGKYWHIDHIKPISKFNLRDKNEVKQAWSLKNLQPLEAKINLQKKDRIVDFDWINKKRQMIGGV